ncbi:MAG: M48 family metallopeptidase [Prevotella sp.]|nr:M48 family metallopeptidase [Prevotella sp.]
MKSVKLLLLSVVAAILTSCGTTSTVPITGRKQNLIVSDEQVLSLSTQQYQQYMASAKKSTNAANTAMVQRVGKNLANAVVSYLNANGLGTEVSQYQWEFNLVQDKQINAFCMPGGKIVVYEGLLPVTQDEASLAVVLGHEIAHAVAKHSAERLSNAYKQQYGMQILGAVAAGMGASSTAVQLGQIVANAGGQFFTAGFSRKQESEADHMGLIFAAMAGYDPQVAVNFWQRMSQATGGGSSSLLSDHPSDADRIRDLQGWMPEALRYYKPTATTATATPATSTKKTTKKTIKISTKKTK